MASLTTSKRLKRPHLQMDRNSSISARNLCLMVIPTDWSTEITHRFSCLAGRLRCQLQQLEGAARRRRSLWTRSETVKLPVGSHSQLQPGAELHLPVWYQFHTISLCCCACVTCWHRLNFLTTEFFVSVRILEIHSMWWTKCHTAMWFWPSYRHRRQLLWSKNHSLLPIETHSHNYVRARGMQLDRCCGYGDRYGEIFIHSSLC